MKAYHVEEHSWSEKEGEHRRKVDRRTDNEEPATLQKTSLFRAVRQLPPHPRQEPWRLTLSHTVRAVAIESLSACITDRRTLLLPPLSPRAFLPLRSYWEQREGEEGRREGKNRVDHLWTHDRQPHLFSPECRDIGSEWTCSVWRFADTPVPGRSQRSVCERATVRSCRLTLHLGLSERSLHHLGSQYSKTRHTNNPLQMSERGVSGQQLSDVTCPSSFTSIVEGTSRRPILL